MPSSTLLLIARTPTRERALATVWASLRLLTRLREKGTRDANCRYYYWIPLDAKKYVGPSLWTIVLTCALGNRGLAVDNEGFSGV